MLHADMARSGTDLRWIWYPKPSQDLIDSVELSFGDESLGWEELEPNYT